MASLDVRSNSAVMKRAEQLKRWEESETNQALSLPLPETGRKVRFSSGCVFLAACLAADKEEVLKLLEQGADINTANVDGLTALHQACIDDNLDMVEFLVENGADINRQDNEGWTPLHATASCGFVSIARYLVENGADVSAVNSDGDLALDLAMDSNHIPMIDFMQEEVRERQVDVVKARTAEESMMLEDAKKWLRSDAAEIDRPHPKTGATALHVAAAKGYTKVLNLLLAGRPNVDKQDNDGWTPLHAAAHWNQREAAEMLVNAMADMDIENFSGQSCIDVAERKMVKFLEELRANNKRAKRRPSSQLRISDGIENLMDKTPSKIVRVEKRNENKEHPNEDKQKTLLQKQQNAEKLTVEDEAPWRRQYLGRSKTLLFDSPTNSEVPDEIVKSNVNTNINNLHKSDTPNEVILRRTQSFENDKKPIISGLPTASSIQNSTNTSASTAPSTATTTPTIRRSFVPPVRDEESETQRKAHAKRVRETRRSTQGVTLDEIKSAEELVKKKNLGGNNNNNWKLEDASSETSYSQNNSTIIPTAPAVIAAASLSSSSSQRRFNSISGHVGNQTVNSVGRPLSTTGSVNNSFLNITDTAADIDLSNNSCIVSEEMSATPASSNNKEKDNDKENENRSILATQTVIQRRRKPKRRSTGVVHLDMDDLDLEKQDSTNEPEEKESGSERSDRLHLASTSNKSFLAPKNASDDVISDNKKGSEEGGDYKALWEAAKVEIEKLKLQLKKKDDEVSEARLELERLANKTSKNSLSENEKRERRAMERKFSEMEEELKQLESYKNENTRLKEENGALIRVISKLSK